MMLKKEIVSTVRKALLWAGLILVVLSIACFEDLILQSPCLVLITTFVCQVLII